MRVIKIGTLDDRPEWLIPDVHIYTSTKAPWYVIPEGQPSFDEFYDITTIWSKEQLERLTKVMEKVNADKENGATWTDRTGKTDLAKDWLDMAKLPGS